MATYNITTLAELQAINGGHEADDCVLLNDIDASATRTWNQGSTGYEDEYYGFVPIGSSTIFTGSFDGNNFKITNLYINRTDSNGSTYHNMVGLFGHTGSTATIHDLTLENFDYTGGKCIGGLVAQLDNNWNIDNVSVSGTIESTAEYATDGGIGGFIGESDAAASPTTNTIDDCSATVQITATTTLTNYQMFGGFVGNCKDENEITNCVAAGTITLAYNAGGSYDCYVGGFFGESYISTTCVSCTSAVDIEVNLTNMGTGEIYIGGFSGRNGGNFDKCFAFGNCSSLSDQAAYVGGFIGKDGAAADIDQCGASGNVENYSEHATENHAGGFAADMTTSAINNCFAKGTVNVAAGLGHANQRIGGFCGESAITITYCYSVGEVYSTGNPTNGGGFLGLSTGSTETGCFFDNQTSGYTTDGGSATGKSTTLMKTESTFTGASWDFDDVWRLPSYTRSPGSGIAVWFSGTGDYEDFEQGVKDANSFNLTIPTTNSILWTESLKSLLLGTAGDEWKIGSNKLDTPITPSNFGAKQQTNYGSSYIQAVKVNDVILFVDFVGRKVHEMTAGDFEGEYIANDMTALAEHITETGIVCMAHQKNPDSILWCVLTDGSLISMVYDRKQNVIAWSDHPIDGTVLSVCVTPAEDEDDVWITVKRTINSSDVLYVEKFATRIPQDIDDSYYLDSMITTSLSSSDTITGFDHLIGESVIILGDGVNIGTFTVNASGNVVLAASTSYTTVQGGLSYSSILQPMRLVSSGPEGSTIAALTRVPEIKVSFLNAKQVQYGDSESALYDIDFTDTRLEDAAYITGLFSGDVRLSMQGGISVQNPILISASGPFPCTIKSIIPSFEETGR